MSTDKMADKIAKLLAKAEGTDNAAEAQAFSEAAERLMVKWGIEEAMVRAAAEGHQAKPDPIIEKAFRISSSTYGQALMTFMHEIALGMGLRSFRRGWHTFYAVGHESDVERFAVLVASLELQAFTALKHWWKENSYQYEWYSDHEKYKTKFSFIASFGTAVGRRLRQMNKEETEAIPGSALAVLSRQEQIDAHMAEKTLGKNRAQGYGGNSAGRAAGERANLGGSSLGRNSELAR